MRRALGNDVELGFRVEGHSPLRMSSKARRTHLYVSGTTGTGKSKFLQHLIQQDIKNWRNSKCGLLVIDPHGTLYDSLMRWLAWSGYDRPIVPIDLRQDEWIVAYNLLRQRPDADPAVLVNNFVQAMAYVWGESGTQETPRFARWAKNILWALYEKKLTLLEAVHLINPKAGGMRYDLTQNLSNLVVSQDWALANKLSEEKLGERFESTSNRLHPFLQTKLLKAIFGQMDVSLDLGKAISEGQIILVNLATRKNRISPEDAALFATLLLSDLWSEANDRGKGTDDEDVKPFYLYVDEFQNFITPTIAKNLDQARGFGLHLTLANQFPRQILHAGANGPQVYDSVMANARSKVVFAMAGEENLHPLAFDLFMGTMSPDKIRRSFYSTKVMNYAEEIRTSYTTGRSVGTSSSVQRGWSEGEGAFTGQTDSISLGGAVIDNEAEDPDSWNVSGADSDGTSRTWTQSESETEGTTSTSSSSQTWGSMLIPKMGKELSQVESEPIADQLFKAMSVLHDQTERHFIARMVGSRVPVAMYTPTIQKKPGSPERIKRFLDLCYSKLPFALRNADAHKAIDDRERKMIDGVANGSGEPTAIKRKVAGNAKQSLPSKWQIP